MQQFHDPFWVCVSLVKAGARKWRCCRVPMGRIAADIVRAVRTTLRKDGAHDGEAGVDVGPTNSVDSPSGLAQSACAALMTSLVGDRYVDDNITILTIGCD